MSIRCTSKAMILNDGKVLLNKCKDKKNGDYYSLPGGGQNKYETISEAIVRECLEETGYTVIPVRFIALCEEICDNLNFRECYPDYAHKMYHIFLCNLSGETVATPTEKDTMQICCEWIDVDKVHNLRILPKVVGNNILKIINSNSPLFLGSEHIDFNHG